MHFKLLSIVWFYLLVWDNRRRCRSLGRSSLFGLSAGHGAHVSVFFFNCFCLLGQNENKTESNANVRGNRNNENAQRHVENKFPAFPPELNRTRNNQIRRVGTNNASKGIKRTSERAQEKTSNTDCIIMSVMLVPANHKKKSNTLNLSPFFPHLRLALCRSQFLIVDCNVEINRAKFTY